MYLNKHNQIFSEISDEHSVNIKHYPKGPSAPHLKKSEVEWENINRICFRGDTRAPDDIFSHGFSPRKHGEFFISKPFVSNPNNVVAFTPRFVVAACFPFNVNVEWTWVYVFKARHGINLQMYSYNSRLEKGMRDDEANYLYAQEIISDKIPPADIIAAVRVLRAPPDRFDAKLYGLAKFLSLDDELLSPYHFLTSRGKYFLHSYLVNQDCQLPNDEIELAVKFIEGELLANRTKKSYKLPVPASGFVFNLFSKPKTISKGQQEEVQGRKATDLKNDLNASVLSARIQ